MQDGHWYCSKTRNFIGRSDLFFNSRYGNFIRSQVKYMESIRSQVGISAFVGFVDFAILLTFRISTIILKNLGVRRIAVDAKQYKKKSQNITDPKGKTKIYGPIQRCK